MDRLTYEQVAAKLAREIEPVAVSTLKRWAKQFGWRAKRQALAQAQADIAGDTIMARSRLLKALLDDPNPQLGFAVSSMEALAIRQAEAVRAGQMMQAQRHKPKREIKTRDDVAEALREAMQNKLAVMLDDPDQVSFRAVADIKKAMEIVKDMRSTQPDEGQPGIEADKIDKMIEALG